MILKAYPDYNKKGFDINAPCPVWRWPNMIIHNKTKSAYYPEHTGPLTVKFVIKGFHYFKTKEKEFVLGAGNYLILNQGQKYSAKINSETEVEAIEIFFRPEFAEQVLSSLIIPEDKLLEDPHIKSELPVRFIERIQKQSVLLTTSMMKFKLASENNLDDEDWFEDEYFTFLKNMLVLHRKVNEQISNISSSKLSTKYEIYRRLNLAKDYIDECFTQDIKVEDAAKIACLSLFHFIRTFKNTYGDTPKQYIIKKRLAKASDLIMHTDLSVTQICFEIGFNSLSTFSWLFKQKFGLYPEELRNSYQNFLVSFRNLKPEKF